ncbi:GntR family transcriptional regulator [Caballeronia udeis]|jgi:GntR family transcriptional regulator|uniref:GntR family transcriptional regulator n=1 Tax=Caballeronia udeis TaxID=1232866 RepID=A0ABW8MZ04_9BURK
MKLQRENATPLYEQMADTLRAEIERGAFGPTGKLPSEAELSERFRVSRVTVRLAIGKLATQNLVERKQGKGTFATARQLTHRLDVLQGFYDSLARQGAEPQMALLRFEERPVPKSAQWALAPDVGTCMYVERVHSVDDKPVALAQTYLLPEARVISREQAASTTSYEMIESILGWTIDRADISISAVAASGELARGLGVRKLAPLLVMKRTSYLTDGRACETTVFHIRPEHYEFVLSSTSTSVSITTAR